MRMLVPLTKIQRGETVTDVIRRIPAPTPIDPQPFLNRDETNRQIDAFRPARELDDHLIEVEAETYRRSTIAKTVSFVAWLVIRGYDGGW